MTSRYPFGKNWKRFLERTLNEERIVVARDRLLESLRLPHLEEKTFLDIGCGSGLHSLAAFEAGAQKILSLDYDQDSVEATQFLWSRAGCPDHWMIMQADVLDRKQIRSLGQWDVVYSWGVLHHTGHMWDALRNASIPLADNGVLLVALYTADVCADPEADLALKRQYNQSTSFGQRMMESRLVWEHLVYPNIKLFRPWVPVTTVFSYKRHRGMSYYTDVRDWLGGWPMEFAGVAETKSFAKEELGLDLIACYGGAANTEYLWCRKDSDGYWGHLQRTEEMIELSPPFPLEGDLAFSAPLPPWLSNQPGASLTTKDLKALHLVEDNQTLGPNTADLKQIQGFGSGAFNIVNGKLIFSGSDTTNPNTNHRRYVLGRWPLP